MKLTAKMNLVSMGILTAVACAFAAAGVMSINRIAYDLNLKVMAGEVQNLVGTVRSAHEVLRESGVATVESYLLKAREDLSNEFRRYHFGKTGELAIVAKPNTIIYHPSLNKERTLDLECLPQMGLMGKGALECQRQGENRFYSFETYPEWDWLIILSITTEEVLEARTQFLKHVALILLASLVLGSLLFFWFTNRMVKPVHQLAEATGHVGRGEWNVPLPAPRGNDEVAQLTLAFQDMSGKLAASYRSLQEKIQQIEQSREALRASEERFRSLVETTSDWVWELDESGKYTYCSPKVKDLLGYEPEELIGKVPADFVAPFEKERFEKTFHTLVTSREGFAALQKSCLGKDGNEVLIETGGVPFCDVDGNFQGYRGIDRDITDRKKLEEGLMKAQRIESIGLLAGGLAHDFNNILTAILGNISLAKSYTSPDEKVYRRLEETEKASLKAKDLTQQLLTFSRGGAPVKKTIDLGNLVNESVAFALRGSKVRCNFSIPPDLWLAEVDEGQIGQVVNNLVINAVHSMPEGGTIELQAANMVVESQQALPLRPGRYVKVSIRDHGKGIPREHLAKIFDPYFTTKSKGSGLGLPTAYSIINRHEGHIEVESEPGRGTSFTIYLPASEAGSLHLEHHVEPPREGKGRILVMDDEEFVREVIGEMLGSLGYEVAFARDGTEAIAVYKAALASGESIEAVIMDLTIPGGMGGKEAIKELLTIDPKIKAIVSSGYSHDPVMSNCQEYGFRSVIGKPYRLQDLSRILQHVILSNSSGDDPHHPGIHNKVD
jgi:PAS domain S-box-containing protein